MNNDTSRKRAELADKATAATGLPISAVTMGMRAPQAASPSKVTRQSGLDLVAPGMEPPAQPVNPNAVRLQGTVLSIRHEQVDEDFYIFQFQPIGTSSPRDRLTVKGHGIALKPDMSVDIKGEWITHPTYGRQIDKALVNQIMPVSVDGIRRLLSNGFVKVIGAEVAEKLLRRFGNQLFDVAEMQPELLREVEGVGVKRVEALVKAVKEKRAVPRIMSFLAQVGLGPQMSHRVYRDLGQDAVQRIKKDPYSLTSIPMIGFSKADLVARMMGVPFDSNRRIVAAMEAVLQKASDSGSTALRVETMKKDMSKLLTVADGNGSKQVDLEKISDAVEMELQSKGRIQVRELTDQTSDEFPSKMIRTASLSSVVADEKRIAQHIKRLCVSSVCRAARIDPSNPRFAHLDESQMEAARTSLIEPVSVITGRPGCGKTTVTKSIIECMKAAGLNVLCVAPTGKAAKRMTEATGEEAMTVHRALQSMGAGKFGRDENNPLVADVVFADEFSMMGTGLTERFMRALKTGTQLVIIGDNDQLASIDPGAVLADIIASETVPVSVLSKIHRQAADSSIIANAHRIISGRVPQSPEPGKKQDFEMIDCNKPEMQAQVIVDAYKRLRASGFGKEDIQILTPMRKASDPLSSTALNNALKQLVNPADKLASKDSVKKGKFDSEVVFSVGDRIMQMANNRELGLFNGDVGYLVEIDRENKTMLANFNEDIIEMSISDIDDLDLAYATTIHKSQGSEYKAVIIPLSAAHSHMLDRNLLYTAETRGKQHVVLAGDLSILERSVRKSSKRLTGLRDELLLALDDAKPFIKASEHASTHTAALR